MWRRQVAVKCELVIECNCNTNADHVMLLKTIIISYIAAEQ